MDVSTTRNVMESKKRKREKASMACNDDYWFMALGLITEFIHIKAMVRMEKLNTSINPLEIFC